MPVSVPTADALGADLKVSSHLKGNNIKSPKAVTHWNNTRIATDFSLCSNQRSWTGRPWASLTHRCVLLAHNELNCRGARPLVSWDPHHHSLPFSRCHGSFIITPRRAPVTDFHYLWTHDGWPEWTNHSLTGEAETSIFYFHFTDSVCKPNTFWLVLYQPA